ncbi:MAG: hydantoinase, partial [Planctomycetes bacterium]|nr:hydantoinase [Planctomycetota bacterium]
MSDDRWQFWIDVGGTFTDAFARRPDGVVLRTKVLSSGVTKGQFTQSDRYRRWAVDPSRRVDPPSLWDGYVCRLLDPAGAVIEENVVERFDAETGHFHFLSAWDTEPVPHQAYELTAREEAPVLAIRQLLGLPLAQPIPPVILKLGTTRGTNALITRCGARTALVTTRGFADILR